MSGPKDIAKNLYALFHHKLIQRRHNDFTNLMHSALQLTPKFYEDLSQMGDLETQYDVFVSGSDQIWNMDAWDYSDAYFLSFVHHKPKVSYASSMGVIFLTNVEIRHLLTIIEHYWLITSHFRAREDCAGLSPAAVGQAGDAGY